jgi:hypothetical protein
MRYYRFLADVTCYFGRSTSKRIIGNLSKSGDWEGRQQMIQFTHQSRRRFVPRVDWQDHQTGINSIKDLVEEQNREMKKLPDDPHPDFIKARSSFCECQKSTLKVSITSSQGSLAVTTGIPANGSEKNMINGLHQISRLSGCVAEVYSDIPLEEIVSND